MNSFERSGSTRCRDLKVNASVEPTGVGSLQPVFSWVLSDAPRGAQQREAQVRLRSVDGSSDFEWESPLDERCEPFGIAYDGPALDPLRRYEWQVRVRLDDYAWTEWSDPSTFVTDAPSWAAEWIGPTPDHQPTGKVRPAIRYRGTFELPAEIESAYLLITSHGVHGAWLNGIPVSDERLRPGFTSFGHRLQYRIHDVAEFVRPGANVLGVEVADGWYRGLFMPVPKPNIWGDDSAVRALLVVRDGNDGEHRFISDGSWTWSADGPIRASSLVKGEVHDVRQRQPGWSTTDFDGDGWSTVVVTSGGSAELVPQRGPSVRCVEELTPIEVRSTGDGRWLFDLGRNIGGTIRLRATRPAGTTVVATVSEALNAKGRPELRPYWFARQRLQLVTSGSGEADVCEGTYIFHGFRFVEVDGLGGETPPLSTVTGLELTSAHTRVGQFATGHELVDQLHRNLVTSASANLIEIPTDCPHREKLGWTDAVEWAPTTLFLADLREFYGRWLDDVAAEQRDDGAINNQVPEPQSKGGGRYEMSGAAGWGDVATILPWAMYEHVGDRRILAERYPMMKRWVDYLAMRAEREPPSWRNAHNLTGRGRAASSPFIVNTGHQFGDWLTPDATNPVRTLLRGVRRVHALVATAFFARSVELTARAAEVLGEPAAPELRSLHADIRAAFAEWFVDDAGHLLPDTQSSYVLALAFGLVEPAKVQSAADRLAGLVREAGTHPTTGFVATPYLCPVLTEHGHEDCAIDLLLQESAPSWLGQVTRGATSIWEQWEGVRADGRPRLLSQNHMNLGSIGEWIYRDVAGIAQMPGSVGWGHVRVRPIVDERLQWVRARHRTVRGDVATEWRLREGTLTIDVEIPPTARATVLFPTDDPAAVTCDGEPLSSVSADAAGRVAVEVPSGTARFEGPAPAPRRSRGQTISQTSR